MKEASKTCTHPNNFTQTGESKQDNHGTNQHSPKRQGHQNTVRKRPYNIWHPSYPMLCKTDCVGWPSDSTSCSLSSPHLDETSLQHVYKNSGHMCQSYTNTLMVKRDSFWNGWN